jgi:hypothetical protein
MHRFLMLVGLVLSTTNPMTACADTLRGGADFSVDIDVLVQTGTASPDGNGVFANAISPPILNNQSQALIWSNLVATTDPGMLDDNGFFRLTRSEIVTLARGGDAVDNGAPLNLTAQLLTQQLGRFAQQGLAKNGDMFFVVPDLENVLRYFRADGSSLDTLLTSGQMTDFVDELLLFTQLFTLNDIGHPHFVTVTPEFTSGLIDEFGPRLLITPGQALPDGREAVGVVLGPAPFRSRLNNADQKVLPVQTVGMLPNNAGLYRTDGTTVVPLLHLGEPAVDGLGTYATQLGAGTVSESGSALILQFVDDFAADYLGLFLHDGDSMRELVRTGTIANGPGTITNISSGLQLNGNDTAVFQGLLVDEFGNQLPTVLAHRQGAVRPILSEFEQLPPPIGFETRGPLAFALNEQDQIAIFGFVIAEGVSRRAIFLYDFDFGLALVAREGMPLAGSVISKLDMAIPLNSGQGNIHNSNATNGINDLGEISFSFTLENGQVGAALAAVEFTRDDVLFSDRFESLGR